MQETLNIEAMNPEAMHSETYEPPGYEHRATSSEPMNTENPNHLGGGALQRVVSSAVALGANAAAADRFLAKSVLLIADGPALASSNGRMCFDAALRLLIRTSSNVSVHVGADLHKWLIDLRHELERHSLGAHVRWCAADEILHREAFDAVLHVGSRTEAYDNLTSVHSDGWLIRLASAAPPIPMTFLQPNPLGAIAAAAFGAAEVFKRLVEVRSERGPLHARLEFSLWDYSEQGDSLGAPLPSRMEISALIAGLGAIGNAMAYILRELPAGGSLWVVDRQVYGPENLGTCIALDDEGLGKPKTAFATRYLEHQYRLTPLHGELRAGLPAYVAAPSRPRVMLGGLDNIPARHDLQDFWPDLLFDGALGESFACQVSRWRWGEDAGCLRCQFVETEFDSITALRLVTGLEAHRLADAGSLITSADVEAAPAELRPMLTAALGKPVCSVTSRAMMEKLSSKSARSAPSVPFVAVLSAAMVLGEYVKEVLGDAPVLRSRYQFDVLYGPQGGMVLAERRREECPCTANVGALERFRRGLAG
jgi:hypothetical protein